jgi:hypothetical protein
VRRVSIALLGVVSSSAAACILFTDFAPLADAAAGDAASADAQDVVTGGDAPLGDSEAPCGPCSGVCVLGRCIVPRERIPDSKDEAPSDGTNAIACPAPDAAAWGQDCNYRSDVPSFVTSDDLAADTVTGLVWERRSSGVFTAPQISAHCQALAASFFAGFSDWRTPTAREALTLANTGKNDEGLDQSVFVSEVAAWIWTSTPVPASPGSFVRLGGIYPNLASALGTLSGPGSRCVRGGPLPGGSLAVGASGKTVVDPRTGLTWQRDVASASSTWLEALATCNTLVLDGASEWRLPSYKELWSIVDITRSQPAIDPMAFPNTPPDHFWSSSPVGQDRTRAYFVDFAHGAPSGTGGFPMTDLKGVRCVRGGS